MTTAAPAQSAAPFVPDVTKWRRYPLHIHISVLFTLLIVVFGAITGWHNYQQNTSLMLSASDELFESIGRETVLEINRTYAPIELLTDLIAKQQLTEATSLEDRLPRLPGLTEALTRNPAMSAFYVGYASGDFFLVRPLPTEQKLRDNLGAPPAAAYLVQSIDHDNKRGSRARFIYLDARLKPLLTVERPDYRFDPRTREWYMRAMASEQQIKSDPYVFFTTRLPGITMARKNRSGVSVVGADVGLADISERLQKRRIAPSAEIVLFDAAGRALASSRTNRPLWKETGASTLQLATLSDLGGAALGGLANGFRSGNIDRNFSFTADDRDWIGRINKLSAGGQDLYLGVLAPHDELLRDAARIRSENIAITLAILLLTIPVAWLLSRAVSKPLRQLSAEAGAIRNFNFGQSTPINSFVLEIDDLAQTMDGMKSTIRKFLDLSTALAAESDLDRLLERVVSESMALAHADAAVVYLLDDDGVLLQPTHRSWRNATALSAQNPLASLHLKNDAANQVVAAARSGSARVASLRIGDSDVTTRYFADAMRGLRSERLGVAVIPLRNRHHDVIGVLAVGRKIDNDTAVAFSPELIAFIEALSGTTAISIETRQLIKAQKDLLESLIQLVASAIDAKSPYTGGHCQRVPELTKMLAQAACAAESGPYRDFNLNAEEWEAVHIASWLHDCGKVTTPEYVVDKATKLETIYDRIHEIRTRFEVLKRDAEIDYWKTVAAGGDAAALKPALQTALAELDADFAFVAECNIGGEFMAAEKIERLRRIAGRHWLRTLDARLGVSHDEKKRMERAPAAALPAREQLLADKAEHIIDRPPQELMSDDNPWGFKLTVPLHKYNRGEIHNLAISRGTLTDEDRFIINDHIVQTIIMLSRLPFPKHLRGIPEIAGGHHEKMDGTGYPKRLSRDEMSPVARMMAIADIFEALTAADRPYKKGKALSEAIKIMGFMKKDRHIDPELFELFLTSNIHRQYAERYMRPEQIDDVDIRPYLSQTV